MVAKLKTAIVMIMMRAISFQMNLSQLESGILHIASTPMRSPQVGATIPTMAFAAAKPITMMCLPTPAKSASGAMIPMVRVASPELDGITILIRR